MQWHSQPTPALLAGRMSRWYHCRFGEELQCHVTWGWLGYIRVYENSIVCYTWMYTVLQFITDKLQPFI